MKYLIYSSIIGSYDSKILSKDQISNQEYLNNFDFILYTNMRKLKSNLWKIIQIDESQYIFKNDKLDEPRTSYYPKTNPHLLSELKDYSLSVWVDSSITDLNLKELYKHCEDLEKSQFSLAVEKHPGRNCVYQELEACIILNKDDPNEMINHVEQYRKEGMPSNYGLIESGYQVRKHHDSELIKFQEFLWNQMLTRSRRDQLSWNYCTWKLNFKNYKLFTFEDKCKVLHFVDHSNSPTRKEKVLLCGPFQGEIGFELFAFNGFIRTIVQQEPFDSVVIGTTESSRFLYEDIADKIIIVPDNGIKNKWQNNGKDPYFKIENTQGKDLRLVRPSEELSYNLLANIENQEFIKYNFPESFKSKYPDINTDELNEAFRTKNIPNYLRKQLNLPMKNEFCFIVVGGKAEKYIERCLTSIKNQTNQNWKCAVVLTETEDKTFEKAKNFESDKITVVKTSKNNFVIKNYLKAIQILKPSDNSILVNVDADDWLVDNDVLTKIDIEYMKNPNLMITCGSWKTFPDYINIPSNCIPYTVDDFKKGIRKVGFRGTHLRTMKHIVFKNIDEKEFKDSITGEIYNVAADVAIMNPALEMVGFENYKFIKDILYVYNRETDFNEDKEKKQQSIDTTIDVSKKEVLSQKNFKKYQEFYLLDESFPHGKTVGNYNFKNFDSLITWNRTNSNLPCVFFTDFRLNDVLKYNGKENFALLIEPPVIFPQIYEQIQKINHHFKYVFTFNEDLLKLGQNYKKYLHSSCWIEPRLQKDYEKNKDISIVVSNMRRTPNHVFRHEIVNKFKNDIDIFGKAYKYIDNKIESLANYKFQIVVENCDMRYYSTEKIIDCFATKTIPIYGKSNKFLESDFGFDSNGIIRFESLEELNEIIKNIKNGKINYIDKLEVINYNFQKCKDYQVLESWLYKNYFTNEKL